MSAPVAEEAVEFSPIPASTPAEPAAIAPQDFDRDFDVSDEPDTWATVPLDPDAAQDSSPHEPEEEPTKPCEVTLRLSFLDPSGHSIEGLAYRIVVGDTTYSGSTDADGRCTPLPGLLPGSSLEILIRKDDGSFVSKHRGEVLAGDMEMCGISPWIKIPVATEEHHGTPTTPPPIASAPKVQQAPSPATSAKSSAGAIPPPVNQRPTGGKKPDVQPHSCRSDQGHPRARLGERFVDWANRHGVPTFGLWSWKKLLEHPSPSGTSCTASSAGAQQAPSTSPHSGAGASPSSNKPATANPPALTTPASTPRTSPPSSASVSSLDQAPPRQVSGLMEIMEHQVKWPWASLPSAGEIVTRINVKTFNWPAESKPETQSDHRCYKSVKVGLWRAGYVRSVNEDIPAHTAGPWLLREGFKDVTRELPDARWAWPGDVIVYQYPEAKRAKNDVAAKEAYQMKLKAYEQQKDAAQKRHDEWATTRKSFDTSKADWEEANAGKKYPQKFTKPEPKMPPQPKGPDDTNYGHIDVRSYESYLSDFHPKSNSLPPADKFVVSGVYRKLSDPLADVRLRAFLKVLREWECHEEPVDEKRYFMLLKPINGVRRFSETSRHPQDGISNTNTAAGAYQITLETYGDFVGATTGIPNGFTPAIQDRIAVAILEVPPRSGASALAMIRAGHIDDAVRLLSRRWSSLPGGGQPRKGKLAKAEYVYTMDDLLKRHRCFMQELIGKA
jgi:muramidase (phage lysozyme)